MRPTRRSAARATLTAELIELLRGAPELVAFGREEDTLERVRRADRELARLARRDAFAAGVADSLAILVAGATVVGVLAAAVAAHNAGELDRVFVAALALLALASFESVAPLAQTARELRRDVDGRAATCSSSSTASPPFATRRSRLASRTTLPRSRSSE